MTDTNTNNDEKLQLNKNLDEADSVNAEVDLDDSKAKFINGGSKIDEAGAVHVEIASSSSEVSFNGLGKEELMKYATDPFWVRLRWVLFILFWVGWVAMLVAAILIIVFAPRCPHRPDLKWYNKEATYQVFTQSFKDTDGDGVGDIKGIESKLSYFEDLGIKALWLNSIFKSDNVDGGNGIIDYKMIDPRLGTMEDFTSLTKKMFQKEMRLIVDFIPNHTSKNHTWFQKSSKGEAGYEDYYIWSDTDQNGWRDIYGKSAWEYDATRTKYYLHQTAKEFPDLNLRNPAVKKEMEEILRFWADKGVYGFNIVGAEYLTENANLTAQTGSSSSETVNYPDNVEIIQQFRKVINSLSDKPGRERVLMANFPVKYDRNTTYQYFGDGDGLLMIPSRLFAELDNSCDGNCLERQIKNEEGSVDQWRGWILGDQDLARAATRYKSDIRLIQVIQMLLPGTAYIYYGDEIGMENGVYAANPPVDVLRSKNGGTIRDPFRTPMQWDNTPKAGFTEGTPYIPFGAKHAENNVATEEAHRFDTSYTSSQLQMVKDLLELRQMESFMFGNLHITNENGVLIIVRKAEGFPGYMVAVNLDNSSRSVKFSAGHNVEAPSHVQVAFHSGKMTSEKIIDVSDKLARIPPKTAIVFKFVS